VADNVQKIDETFLGGIAVRGYLHAPARPEGDGLILTHGAGANCQSALLVSLASKFCEAGLFVLRCDLPFRQLRPHGPPMRGSAEKDQQGLRAAVEFMKSRSGGRVYLGGHSYGGRQSSMLAASEPGLVDALLLLSYPLHPPKRPAELRTAHFPFLRTPALFVHGTRDGFGSVEEMESALQLIAAPAELMTVEAAGHELLTARNRPSLSTQVGESFAEFLGHLPSY
jgi:predicted alpha/beta-hydrolase family hydrolase